MNEIIKRLAIEADEDYTGEYNDDMGHAIVGNEAIERFARLIIRQCISLTFNAAPTDETARDLRQSINQYFGVDE